MDYKINDNGVLRDMTSEEKAEKQASDNAWQNGGAFASSLKNLRLQRNSLLADSDWMANSDVTMSDEWRTYRQELRDITNGLTTIEEIQVVEFPVKPS